VQLALASLSGVVPESLIRAIGTPIRRVRRMHYVYSDQPDTDFGPVELTVGEQLFLFDNEPDGESLRITGAAWIDPFAEPLSAENREFVARSGKWTAFDVSADRAWASLIGEVLSEVEPIVNSAHKMTGIILRTEHGGVVRLGVEADELFLDGLVTPG
jgi:hypothetical protein